MKTRLNGLIKWILFLIAYYPLFLILIIQNSKLMDRILNLDFNNFKFLEFIDPIILGLLAGIIFFILIKVFIKFQTNTNTFQFEIVEIVDISHETLNYMLTYLIAFLSLNLTNPKEILCIVILLFIIGIIYINSNLLYVNPMLQLFGYSIYKLSVTRRATNETSKIIIISKTDKIKKNAYIDISLVNEGAKNIYFVK